MNKSKRLELIKFINCMMFAVVLITGCLFSNYELPKINAEDASIVITVDKKTVNVGDAFNVKVTYSSTVDSAYLEWTLSYNSSVVSHSGTAGKIAETYWFENETDDTKNVSKSYSFIAESVGKAEFSISATSYKLDPGSSGSDEMTIKKSGATVTVADVGSNDATLSELSVSSGELVPKFSPGVTEYSVTVPFEVNTLYVYATENDERASHVIEGSEFLEVGTKQRIVVVTAQDGTVKKYTVKITRLPKATAKPAETPSAKPTTTPSVNQSEKPTGTPSTVPTPTPDNSGDIIINNIKYEITINYTNVALPEGFETSSVTLSGKQYDCFKGISKDLVLFPLTDGKETSLFVYDKEKSLFYPYSEISVKSGTYSILTLKGDNPSFSYDKTVIKINNVDTDAYKITAQNDDFYIVKAVNWDGEENYYCYDKKENTMQRYISEKVNLEIVETNKPNETNKPVETENKNSNKRKSEPLDKNIVIMIAIACGICVVFAGLVVFLIVKERKVSKSENA